MYEIAISSALAVSDFAFKTSPVCRIILFPDITSKEEELLIGASLIKCVLSFAFEAPELVEVAVVLTNWTEPLAALVEVLLIIIPRITAVVELGTV
tara:strand:+ start:47 stop:334 length:288 start_codon:yes stop_codon:yes gene_type:complete